jgi:hypothetical protein
VRDGTPMESPSAQIYYEPCSMLVLEQKYCIVNFIKVGITFSYMRKKVLLYCRSSFGGNFGPYPPV